MSMTKALMVTILSLLCVLAATGCSARSGGEDAPPSAEEPPATQTTTNADVPEELLQEMIADLASTNDAEPDTVEIVRAEAVTWSDASLGCAEPGGVYIQMLTEGYWVILRQGGEKYDYRADGGGHFVCCERSDRKDPMR